MRVLERAWCRERAWRMRCDWGTIFGARRDCGHRTAKESRSRIFSIRFRRILAIRGIRICRRSGARRSMLEWIRCWRRIVCGLRWILSQRLLRHPGSGLLSADGGVSFRHGGIFRSGQGAGRQLGLLIEAKPARWLRFTGNYTYDDSLVLESPNFFDLTLAPGNRLAKRPMHSATLVANAHFRRMNWRSCGVRRGRRTDSDFLGFGITSNPSFVRWDLAASYDSARKISALARVENLFDRRYQEAVGYPALGLNYRLGMRFILGGE